MSSRSVVASAAPPQVPARGAQALQLASDLLALTKPRLSTLVLATAGGAAVAAPGALSLPRALLALAAIFGTVGSANALNCYLERRADALMERTRLRPLPAGRLSPKAALAFGLSLSVASLLALAWLANPLTAGLGLVALLAYVGLYTPLKSRTHHAMAVGAVSGALPPVMGWTLAAGELSWDAAALFALLFTWQMPHFIAIAVFRAPEYQRAGVLSLPGVRGVPAAQSQAVAWAVALLVASLAPLVTGGLGLVYAVPAGALSAAFLVVTIRGQRVAERWARRVFLASVLYLTLVFAAIVADALLARGP